MDLHPKAMAAITANKPLQRVAWIAPFATVNKAYLVRSVTPRARLTLPLSVGPTRLCRHCLLLPRGSRPRQDERIRERSTPWVAGRQEAGGVRLSSPRWRLVPSTTTLHSTAPGLRRRRVREPNRPTLLPLTAASRPLRRASCPANR